MIHTKPHKHLPTSAQEPHSNTNTEPKHVVESLSSSLWPDSFFSSPAARFSLQWQHPAPVLYSSLLISCSLVFELLQTIVMAVTEIIRILEST